MTTVISGGQSQENSKTFANFPDSSSCFFISLNYPSSWGLSNANTNQLSNYNLLTNGNIFQVFLLRIIWLWRIRSCLSWQRQRQFKNTYQMISVVGSQRYLNRELVGGLALRRWFFTHGSIRIYSQKFWGLFMMIYY